MKHNSPNYGPTKLSTPYLLFLGDVVDPTFAKTAFGMRDWAPDRCVGELGLSGVGVTTGLPRLTPQQAHEKGARGLLIGVASIGGTIPDSWLPTLIEAMEAGLDIISGMHIRLRDVPALRDCAEATGRRLLDVRVPPANIPVGTGRKRSGKRLLTVGTDCAMGKKYTALALWGAYSDRGIDVDFRATGQTGILIAGSGMPMDAVVADFEAGAAEILSPDADADHWDIIEGQGALFHPGYAAVTLGLLHGSQPDVFVVCHDPARRWMSGLSGFAVPALEEVVDLTIRLGRLTNPAIRCGGISLNTSAMSEEEAESLLALEGARLGLPVADPMRKGPAFERLVEACLSE